MFWNFIHIHTYVYIYICILLLNIRAIPKNLRKLMFLIFFSIGKASPSSDIATDGQYQIALQDRWKQEESNGGHLKATAIKQLKVGWNGGLFLFHLKESSEKQPLARRRSSQTWRFTSLHILSTSFIQFNCFPYSNFRRGCILSCSFSPALGRKKKIFLLSHYLPLSSEKRQSSPGREKSPVRASVGRREKRDWERSWGRGAVRDRNWG